VDEHGREVGPGVEGELRVLLTDLDSTGYLDDPETTARYFRDGCFYPGDRAIRRADGRVRILGRAEDVLNVNGVKIASAPLEQKLERLLGVGAVCLFARFSDSGVEEIAIAIETKTALPLSAVNHAWDEIGIAGPTRVVQFETFPRTTAGMQKIDRKELRAVVFDSQPN
jgi:acyl-coenzyme A synthetase/AMP-(fatty) acid ligase